MLEGLVTSEDSESLLRVCSSLWWLAATLCIPTCVKATPVSSLCVSVTLSSPLIRTPVTQDESPPVPV